MTEVALVCNENEDVGLAALGLPIARRTLAITRPRYLQVTAVRNNKVGDTGAQLPRGEHKSTLQLVPFKC